MPITGEYKPSTSAWVAEQVEEYESSGGTRGHTLLDTGIPVNERINTFATENRIKTCSTDLLTA